MVTGRRRWSGVNAYSPTHHVKRQNLRLGILRSSLELLTGQHYYTTVEAPYTKKRKCNGPLMSLMFLLAGYIKMRRILFRLKFARALTMLVCLHGWRAAFFFCGCVKKMGRPRRSPRQWKNHGTALSKKVPCWTYSAEALVVLVM